MNDTTLHKMSQAYCDWPDIEFHHSQTLSGVDPKFGMIFFFLSFFLAALHPHIMPSICTHAFPLLAETDSICTPPTDSLLQNPASLSIKYVTSVTILSQRDWPDMEPGQHGRSSSTEYPDSEEDDEQRGGEHHLPGVRRRVTDRQRKRHRSSQTCNAHWSLHTNYF